MRKQVLAKPPQTALHHEFLLKTQENAKSANSHPTVPSKALFRRLQKLQIHFEEDLKETLVQIFSQTVYKCLYFVLVHVQRGCGVWTEDSDGGKLRGEPSRDFAKVSRPDSWRDDK